MYCGYIISYELFLYMLSNLSIIQEGSLWIKVYDESLVKEVRFWLESIKESTEKGFLKQEVAVNVGPFLGVFPVSMDMYMKNRGRGYGTVIFSFDYYDRSCFSWKDWFVLPEDRYRMEVTRN